MLSPFLNPSYLLPPLISFIICIGLAFLVWRSSPLKPFSTRLFIGILLSVAAWGLVIFGMRTSPDAHRALLWDRGMPVAALATFVIFYHFTRVYTYNNRAQRGTLIASYVGLALAIALSPTELLIEKMRVEDYGYAPVIGPAAYVIVMAYPILTVAAMRNLVKRYKASPSYEEKNRLVYLILGAGLLVTGVFLDTLSNLPPVVIKTNITFAVLCSIAILKYNLLDIRAVARRSLAYVVASSAIAIPYVGVMFYLTRTLGAATRPFWIHAIIIVVIAVLVRPLYTWSQQLVNRLFYKGRHDYFKSLELFSRETQSITNLKHLCSTVVKLTSGAFQTSSACLLLPSKNNKGLVIESSAGLCNPPSGIVLRNDSVFVKWLTRHPDILSAKEFDIRPQLQSISHAEKNKLEKLGASLYAPIKTQEGQLSGLLILGEKLSQQPFSRQDKRLLGAIGSQVAMAIRNAWLYEEARRTAVALRESEEKIRLVFESMAEGVTVFDISGNIVEINEAQLRMLGYAHKNKLIGQSVFNLITQKDHARIQERLERLLKGSNVENAEVMLLKKDGSELNAEVSAAVIREPTSGTPTGFVTITEDITKRKQLESERIEMEQKAQMASRLASVGEMASGIAHEINNPLTGVIGFAHLLMEKNLPKDTKKSVEIIYESAQRVSDIVTRLLTFSRQQKPSRNRVNINDILKNTLALRDYAMTTENIEITTRLAKDLPWTIADAGQLQQVFLNIIINAEMEMKLANGEGKLSVKTEVVNKTIRISFKDNGPGIAEENLRRIFDPFFTTREAGKGTGLGLSLCHAIVAEHNGQIYARSKPARGATFVVELPILSGGKQTEPVELAAHHPESTSQARILVVDDEPAVRQFLGEILTNEGHEVETVDNSEDAMTMISNNEYTHILLDIKLPGMSGVELYKKIEKRDRSFANKVIFITGDVMGIDTNDFLSKNKVRYIAKPFDIQKLKKQIGSISR